jgi:hypothetical protein
MSTPIRVVMKDGRVIQGISNRLNPAIPEFIKGPLFNFQTARGWVAVNMNDVAQIQTRSGRPT